MGRNASRTAASTIACQETSTVARHAMSWGGAKYGISPSRPQQTDLTRVESSTKHYCTMLLCDVKQRGELTRATADKRAGRQNIHTHSLTHQDASDLQISRFVPRNLLVQPTPAAMANQNARKCGRNKTHRVSLVPHKRGTIRPAFKCVSTSFRSRFERVSNAFRLD